ncbi:MAG: hypothetical protein GX649_12625 [Chloroflexi bacterium]|nr:hypothetical protein [Chloroflexota bacterium]
MNTTQRLLPLALEPLPLGAIHPLGWLRRQLEIQRDGLSGHLDEFWPDVAASGWIGGDAEGWERGPYWLDGVVPLAYLLDDEALLNKVHRWMDHILAHQHPDGWLGPIRDTSRGEKYGAYDPWPVFVALKAMTQYQEATGDERIIPAMERFFRRLEGLLAEQPLYSWGQHRWADLVLSIHWLYARTGEEGLLALAETARAQGFDWRAHYARFPYTERTRPEERNLVSHVVNNAMAIKTAGVWYRQSHEEADRQGPYTAIEVLDGYHGQVTGVFSGDEHLAGRDPSQGTELCAVNEYLYSLEVLLATLGDPALADRLERIAFNALPATFSPDMWAHQYDQQANQPMCAVTGEERVYTSNGPDANIYGLEPNFGCCTANLSQGWPKFAASLWMRTPDGGLAAVAHAPSKVHTKVDGVAVAVASETGYPFRESLTITVRPEGPVRFPLYIRIPAWAEGAQVDGADATPGGFHRLERTWEGETQVQVTLPMRPQVERRYRGAASIVRGPLVYALEIGEEWRQIGGEPPHADWEVHPTTPWNYALRLDPEDPADSVAFCAGRIGDVPFSPAGAPLRAQVQGRRVPDWRIERHAAGPLPPSPVRSEEPLETLTLLPYGCTNLRIAEFPVLGE